MAASSENEQDPIDGMVLAAMKVLDDQVPSGYFEGLPNRTLARLEGSMQTTSGSSDTKDLSGGVPSAGVPVATASAGVSAGESSDKDRDEDSGLHDIRNLASSARMRISSRRVGTNPPPVDEDVLASSSGSWKSIALPEPAKMVSLPDIADLPSKADIKARDKAEKAAAKAADKASRSSRSSGQIPVDLPLAAAPSTSSPSISTSIGAGASSPGLAIAAATAEPVMPPPMHLEEVVPSFAKGTDKGATSELAIGTAKGAMPMIGSRITANKKSNKGLLLGTLGLGLAAAAGIVVYTQVGNKSANDSAPAAAMEKADSMRGAAGSASTAAAQPTPTVQAIATDDKDKKADEVKDEPKVDAQEPVPVDPPVTKKGAQPVKAPPKKPTGKTIIEVKDPGNGIAPKKEPEKKEPANVKKDGEPDLNDLLKEGGYTAPKVDKPKLDKKSLNGADFKNGMNAVRGKAQGCFKGTQGTANVKLVIAPSGQVTKVSVSGQFAGKPEASCVEAAVQGAVFPPWDGGPQSFNYSYLLAE